MSNIHKKFVDDWFFPAIRTVGVSLPVAASLVQIQAEVGASQMREEIEHLGERLRRIEDPISNLHKDVQKVSRAFFDKMVELKSDLISFDENFYTENHRVLSILESEGLIKGLHTFANLYQQGLILQDPSYRLYLGSLCADSGSMKKLYDMLESCSPGDSISSQEVQEETGLPFPIVEAMFKIFEAKGYGSSLIMLPGHVTYIGQ